MVLVLRHSIEIRSIRGRWPWVWSMLPPVGSEFILLKSNLWRILLNLLRLLVTGTSLNIPFQVIAPLYLQCLIFFFILFYRVWYRSTGHFIGFFSQPRLWHLPSAKSVPSTPVRPYDISEVWTLSIWVTLYKFDNKANVAFTSQLEDFLLLSKNVFIHNYYHFFRHCGAFCGLKWRIGRAKM